MAGSNEPNNTKYAYLRQFTTDRLLELLSVAPIPASSPEDEAYVDALEEAILEKECEKPTGFLPDVDQQWAEFQEAYQASKEDSVLPRIEEIFEDTPFSHPEHRSPNMDSAPPVRLRRIWRTALTAAVITVFIFGCMIAAQAAGIDVFGAIARWTEGTFSFSTIRSEDTINERYDNSAENQLMMEDADASSVGLAYPSLQEALDAYGITEVAAPTWIPEGYTLDQLDVYDLGNPEDFVLHASYRSDENILGVDILSYTGEPGAQIEKIDGDPKPFEAGGITFYLIQNTKNHIAAWFTEHYECYISGAHDMEYEVLEEIVLSMLA